MKKTTFVLLYLFSISTFQAQSKLDQAIKTIQDKFSQEKVYLLLDKNQYIAGDPIRFKAFVFNAYNPTDISTTLFVELYNRDKKIIDKKMLPIEHGQSDGTFQLKDDIKEDIYFIRAYTTWMENFSQNFEIVETIPIFNPTSEQKLAIHDNPKWTISAQAEGGNLLNNIPTKLAVRYLTAAEPPKNWSGYLVNTTKPNEKLVTFNNLDQNVALFSFTPKDTEKYQIVVEDKKGNKQSYLLPDVKNTGVNIKVTDDSKGIKYTLISSNLAEGLKGYKVVGTINNRLAYKADIKTGDKEISSIIPVKSSDEVNGVLQLTVFDQHDNPVSQRLNFINPKNIYIDQPDFVSKKWDTKARAYNSFDIAPNDNYTHYSVLIKDNTALAGQNFSKKNILSSLWLSGDFSSPIFSPAQYFQSGSNPEALDALLISEKWQRFDWNSVLSGELPDTKYKPINFLSYKARLALNSRPLVNTPVNLIFKTESEDSNVSSFVTDANGDIFLNNILIDEPVTVHYYLNSKNKNEEIPENLTLLFQNLVEPTVFNGELPETNYYLKTSKTATSINNSISKAINNRTNEKLIKDDETQIEEVKIIAKKQDLKQKLNEELSGGMFTSQDATIFDFVNENQDAATSLNIFEWLQGREAGLTFQRDSSGNLVPLIRNSQANIYLDELKTDATLISTLPISNIAMVKIFKNSGLVSNSVAIYTKRGNMGAAQEKSTPKNNKTTLKTYDKSLPFELPDFSKDIYKKISVDSREVLYWNPNLSEPDNVPPRAKFFNNEDAKSFEVTIIGIGKDDSIMYYNEITQ